MSANPNELNKLADKLYQARTRGPACEPLTQLQPSLTIQDAYAISDINLKRCIEQEKARLVGKKIGLTSRAVQKQLSVHEPDYGYLTSDMAVALGDTIPMRGLFLPKVEGEVAFVLKRRLFGPGITASQVIQATDFILPCIEVIDSRVKDWKIKIQDTVADNASSSHFVLGNEPRRLGRVELALAGMALRVNGEVASTGVGTACLDHPVNAVVWLANKLGEFGVALEPGEVILSGAFGPVVPVSAGTSVEVAISGLGSVQCHFV